MYKNNSIFAHYTRPSLSDLRKLERIKEQLKAHSNKKYPVSFSEEIKHAEIIENRIVLGAELLQEEPEVLAFVLSCAWAHKLMGHDKIEETLSPSEANKLELMADQFAIEFLATFGYALQPFLKYHYRMEGVTPKATQRSLELQAKFNQEILIISQYKHVVK